MGWVYAGVPPYMVEWGARALPPGTVAVETGTYRGDSTVLLARAFGRCLTIERSPRIAEKARARFTALQGVSLLVGSSRNLLKNALASCDGPPFAWLDAHWSGGSTAGDDDPCPVLAEISVLGEAFGGRAVVLVDDARIFSCPSPADQVNNQWPTLFEVLAALEGRGWRTFVLDDVVAGVPPELAASFAALGSRSRTATWGRFSAMSHAARSSISERTRDALRRLNVHTR